MSLFVRRLLLYSHFSLYCVTDFLMHKPLCLNPNPLMGTYFPSPSLHQSQRKYWNFYQLYIGYALQPHLSSWLTHEDELYPGNLGRSVGGILTLLTLLTPAFSLLSAPIVLSIYLLRTKNAPLPYILMHISIASVIRFSPGTSSAQNHSTSELLRTL